MKYLLILLLLVSVSCKVGRASRKVLPPASYSMNEDMDRKASASIDAYEPTSGPVIYVTDTTVNLLGQNLKVFSLSIPNPKDDKLVCNIVMAGRSLLSYYTKVLKDNDKQGVIIDLRSGDNETNVTEVYAIHDVGSNVKIAVIFLWDKNTTTRANWYMKNMEDISNLRFAIISGDNNDYKWDCFPDVERFHLTTS